MFSVHREVKLINERLTVAACSTGEVKHAQLQSEGLGVVSLEFLVVACS